MSDGFTQMLDRAQTFYGQLENNNSRDWFEPRKDTFKTDIEGPAKLFAEIMAEEISRVTGDGHTGKVFRIYRDVRFSKDKSPLKTQLSMSWSTADRDDLAPMFFFAIRPGGTFVACGTPGFAGDDLRRYRAMVDTWGDQLTEVIADTGATISDFGPEPLKRVPKPYAPDHPHADLIRRKSLAISLPLAQGWRDTDDGLVAALTDRIEILAPFRRFMAERL
ncbi:DUF2461 domain-containing protein [Jannaschia donghaensis]|uniref:TIGR02453 family protein n=1 Tax=Jannaschia donghaensis TaxID=420998 RepID=A0A0M6YIP6_9RHOB|nr:DUF2461 domain-containing protein [Jannaschia donghaensis]CTQ49383.1 hypothetical protein JDO7802_01396 [Jannaschia donghaensis]